VPALSRFQQIAPQFPDGVLFEDGQALFRRVAELPAGERLTCLGAALEFADGVRDGKYAKPNYWFAGFVFVDALLERVPADEREPLLARLVDWASMYSKRIEDRGDWASFGRSRKKADSEFDTIVDRALDWGAKEAANAKVKRAAERLHIGIWADGYFTDILERWFQDEDAPSLVAFSAAAMARSFRMIDRAALEACRKRGANPRNVFGFGRLAGFLSAFRAITSKHLVSAFEVELERQAFEPGDGDLLALVLKESPKIEARDAIPEILTRRLLFVAPSKGLAQIAKSFRWTGGAKTESAGPLDEIALIDACARRRWARARELLVASGLVDPTKTRRERALVVAAENGAPPDVIDGILAKRAHIDALGQEGFTALYAARSIREVDHLLEQGADPNAKMKFATGETESALHRAVKLGQKALAVRLLDAGAKVDAKDWRGATPLWTAIERKAPLALVTTLLEHGADPNSVPSIVDDEGPPLWLLCQLSDVGERYLVTAARALVEAGADPRARGEDKRSPVDHAEREGPAALKKLFATISEEKKPIKKQRAKKRRARK
jgi:hypothetical protein